MHNTKTFSKQLYQRYKHTFLGPAVAVRVVVEAARLDADLLAVVLHARRVPEHGALRALRVSVNFDKIVLTSHTKL